MKPAAAPSLQKPATHGGGEPDEARPAPWMRPPVTHTGIVGALTGSSLLATIGLSGLPAWIAAVTALASIFGLAALRSTAFVWRGERNAEKTKADRLERELAAEVAAHDKTRHRLELSEKKPDVDKLYELMKAHDTRMAALAVETTRVLAEVSSGLQANTSALQLWATQQAQNI